MLAFVLAIGMSFAFTNATEYDYYATGFIKLEDGNWYSVNVDCQGIENNCEVNILGQDPATTYQVFDTPNGNLMKTSSTDIPTILDPRS